jgi:hypothetical protein
MNKHTASKTKTTPKTTTPAKPTKPKKRNIDRENLRGLVAEAQAHLAQAALLFACADGSDPLSGAPPSERRERFNEAIAGIAADLECIVDDHCGSAVTS